MLKKTPLKKKIKKKKLLLQEKILKFTKSPSNPRSLTPSFLFKNSFLDISTNSNISLKSPYQKSKRMQESATVSKLLIIKSPKKTTAHSPNNHFTNLVSQISNSKKKISKKITDTKISGSPIKNFEKIYKITNNSISTSFHAVSASSRKEKPNYLSCREYFPDFKLPEDVPLFSFKTKTEKYSLQYYLKNHKNTVNCLALSKDILYTGSIDYYVKQWKLPSVAFNPYRGRNYSQGQTLTDSNIVISHKRPLTSITFKDGNLYTASYDGFIKIFNQSSKLLKLKTTDIVKCLKTADNLLIAGTSTSIYQYDISTLKISGSWDTLKTNILLTQNTYSVYSGHLNGTIKL